MVPRCASIRLARAKSPSRARYTLLPQSSQLNRLRLRWLKFSVSVEVEVGVEVGVEVESWSWKRAPILGQQPIIYSIQLIDTSQTTATATARREQLKKANKKSKCQLSRQSPSSDLSHTHWHDRPIVELEPATTNLQSSAGTRHDSTSDRRRRCLLLACCDSICLVQLNRLSFTLAFVMQLERQTLPKTTTTTTATTFALSKQTNNN